MVVVDAPARPEADSVPGQVAQISAIRPTVPRPTPLPVKDAPAPASRTTGASSALAGQPQPTRPRVSFKAMRGMHALLARNRIWSSVAARIEATPVLYQAFTAAEKAVKERLFGCRMCAQCALPSTAYACPMTCPKQLRNGPCGGVAPDGSCEVYPGTRCVWLIAYERAEQDGKVDDLRRLQRPIDQRKWGESSWVNYWRGRDEGLWTRDGDPQSSRLELPILQ